MKQGPKSIYTGHRVTIIIPIIRLLWLLKVLKIEDAALYPEHVRQAIAMEALAEITQDIDRDIGGKTWPG